MHNASPLQALIAKYRRYITFAIALLVVITCTVVGFQYLYASIIGEPNLAESQKALLLIRRGVLEPDRAGLIVTQSQHAYVTRNGQGKLIVLWPYNLAHDDNYFEGLLFSDMKPVSGVFVALAPTRSGGQHTNASGGWMTHLTVDRNLSEHWFHIQGKMYN